MNKDFALFQSEFKKWQKAFGLTGYKVYFKSEPLEEHFANICVEQDRMVVTVRFNSKVPDEDKAHQDIRQTAKHEAIHLLVGRLEMNGRYRHVSSGEIYEATEELVNRLGNLIP